MPKSPEGSPARSDGPEELFQLFGQSAYHDRVSFGDPMPGHHANYLLQGLVANREFGEIFWIEKVGSASGGPGGVVTTTDEIEHPEAQAQMSNSNIVRMSDLNIRRPTPRPTRVCAATPYRRSLHHPRNSIGRRALDWLDNLLCHNHQPAQRWLVRVALVLWAIVALIMIAETILGP
jgi:hypothetical protein